MWGRLLVVACTALTACMPDAANAPIHAPIFLTAPYDALPPAPAGSTIEPGRPVGLNGRQQESIVLSVLKWMKDPISVQFSGLAAVRNSRSLITVCGQLTGRNTAGRSVGMLPFVGVLMGPDDDADFVLVGIGSTERDRAEVIQLCRASGIFDVG
jgi:hypothetical protein